MYITHFYLFIFLPVNTLLLISFSYIILFLATVFFDGIKKSPEFNIEFWNLFIFFQYNRSNGTETTTLNKSPSIVISMLPWWRSTID